MENKKVPINIINRLLNTGEVVLVTCKYENKTNIITIAWQSPIAHNPPMVCISVGKKRFSHIIIQQAKEFVINIPTMDIFDAVIKCGSVSGVNTDKFSLTKLTPIQAEKVSAPRIKECIGWLECKVKTTVDCRSHTLFIAEVVLAEVKKELFTDHWNIEKVKLIHHLGSNYFYQSSNKWIKS